VGLQKFCGFAFPALQLLDHGVGLLRNLKVAVKVIRCVEIQQKNCCKQLSGRTV